MNRKLIGFFIVTLLTVAIYPTVNSTDKDNIVNISNEITLYDECGCDVFYETYDKYEVARTFKYPVMTELPELLDSDRIFPRPTIIETPDYFSWKDIDGKDYTTIARSQGSCGSCWAFAAIGVLESMLNIRANDSNLDKDLSEQYILSCLTAGSCSGGHAYNAFKCLYDTGIHGNYRNGAIPEFCMRYQARDSYPCSEKRSDWEDHLVPISEYGHFSVDGSLEDIEAIKSQIMQNGPVCANMEVTEAFGDWGWSNHDPDDYYPHNDRNNINHCVMILGWKDDPSIGHRGYWICKNSWGLYFGYDGFFNIEYGSLNIDSSVITWVSLYPTYLNCEGSLSWQAKRGATVKGSFTVGNGNMGEPSSKLEWEVADYPDWGEWTFTPKNGDGLTSEDGPFTVEISVVVPNEEQNFSGNITVINKGLTSDYEKIPVSLVTPKNKAVDTPFLNFLENHPYLFPLLRQLLGL